MHTHAAQCRDMRMHMHTHLVRAVVHLEADAPWCCALLLVWVVHTELHILSKG
jgi:hypothetical protein